MNWKIVFGRDRCHLFSLSHLLISFSRLNENLNAKCQEEQVLNTKLLDLERKNIVLATQSQEVRNSSIEFMIEILPYPSRLNANMN